MSTHAIPSTPQRFVQRNHLLKEVIVSGPAAGSMRVPRALGIAGAIGVLAGIWGGIAPFVGPTFGYSPDGGAAWQWTFERALCAVIPGVGAIVAGAILLSCASAFVIRLGRGGIRVGALLALLAGAWFAFAPIATEVAFSKHYFANASSLPRLTDLAGSSIGLGLLIVMVAGFALGFLSLRAHFASSGGGVLEVESPSAVTPDSGV